MSTEIYVGVDVSKGALDVVIRPTGEYYAVANDEKGIEQIRKHLLEIRPKLVVMEATGGYERELAITLAIAGLAVAVVNPRRVRDFAKALGTLAKTDKVDAGVIAHFGENIGPEARGVPEEEARELDALTTRRQQLVEMRTAEKNRLGVAARSQKPAIQEHIKYLDQQIEKIEQELEEVIEKSPLWQARDELLRSVPAVGPRTSGMLIARVPELGHLKSKEIAALIGVAPYPRDSGTYKGTRRIWGGRADVRTALYMATISAVRCNPVIRAHYQQLRTRGKLAKVALVACMRKLLIILNAMVRSNQHWQARAAAQPA